MTEQRKQSQTKKRTMNKPKFALMLALIVVAFISYFLGKNSVESVEPKTASSNYVNLPDKETVIVGISSRDQKDIESFVGIFYGDLRSKNVKKLLSNFSDPTNEQEQNDLNFLLAKDLENGKSATLPRLFSTQLYNYTLGAYDLRSIKKINDSFIVEVDEMRVMYSGLVENGGDIGYTAKVASFTLELNNEYDGLKILRYYHKDVNIPAKYEGFEAS